jgi:hypothetical protein
MFKMIVIATAITVSLSAYAAHSWVSGSSQTAETFSATAGQCRLVAEIADAGGSFIVTSGHPQFVGGAAARQQNIYTACMEANGIYAAGASGPTDHPSPL